jgi:hypothetical protein
MIRVSLFKGSKGIFQIHIIIQENLIVVHDLKDTVNILKLK